MYKIQVGIKGVKSINDLRKFIKDHRIITVLFGEYHGFINQIEVQKRVIRAVKPDFFLYEMLERRNILNDKKAKEFLSKPDDKDFSVVSKYGQLKPIVKVARSFGLPIIGCDLKNMGVNKDWRNKKYSNEETNKITKKRELQQAKIINQYSSKGLVFALLGNHHIRKNSALWSKLNEKEVIVIMPGFKWEKRLENKNKFKDSEISYIMKVISLAS